jgi:hypothetical protein
MISLQNFNEAAVAVMPESAGIRTGITADGCVTLPARFILPDNDCMAA